MAPTGILNSNDSKITLESIFENDNSNDTADFLGFDSELNPVDANLCQDVTSDSLATRHTSEKDISPPVALPRRSTRVTAPPERYVP